MGHILYNPCRSGVIRTETFTMCGTRNSFVIIKQGIEIEENFDRRSESGEGGEKRVWKNQEGQQICLFSSFKGSLYGSVLEFFFTDKAPKERSLQQSVIANKYKVLYFLFWTLPPQHTHVYTHIHTHF